jgi:hypothetical protein
MAIKSEVFVDAVMQVIQQQIKAEINDEIENQVDAFRQKLLEQADSMAMKVMRAYQVEFDANRVIITVEKKSW